MKIKSKQELKAIAIDVFNRYKKAQKVAVTVDGMAFITDESALAVKNHSQKNRYKKELPITEFTRDDLMSDESGKTKSAKELIAEIEASELTEVVSGILEVETSGEKRKTVIEAAEKRLQELKQPE